jgi:hypothetical protein
MSSKYIHLSIPYSYISREWVWTLYRVEGKHIEKRIYTKRAACRLRFDWPMTSEPSKVNCPQCKKTSAFKTTVH